MSFAEFSYPLMQAWDWWVLFKKGVQVQVGGADQFGNILFGMDAVKHVAKNTAIEIDRRPVEEDVDKPVGLTTPLLTTASGEKLGKSAGNAVWLDKDMTSTFELYQVSNSYQCVLIQLTNDSTLCERQMTKWRSISRCLLSCLSKKLPRSWQSRRKILQRELHNMHSLRSLLTLSTARQRRRPQRHNTDSSFDLAHPPRSQPRHQHNLPIYPQTWLVTLNIAL